MKKITLIFMILISVSTFALNKDFDETLKNNDEMSEEELSNFDECIQVFDNCYEWGKEGLKNCLGLVPYAVLGVCAFVSFMEFMNWREQNLHEPTLPCQAAIHTLFDGVSTYFSSNDWAYVPCKYRH